MERTVLRNNKGMSLIEMLFALALLMIVSFSLMQMQLTGLQVNVRNITRDEAVGIADMKVNDLMMKPFNDTLTDPGLATVNDAADPPGGIPRTIRSFSITFYPKKTIIDLTPDTKQITMTVTWSLRGQSYTHSVTTIKRKT